MFAQLKKKIEDKENANIPHVIISPNSISTSREQLDADSPVAGPTSSVPVVRTRKMSGDGKSKIPVLQDGGMSNSTHTEETEVLKDGRQNQKTLDDQRTTKISTDKMDVSVQQLQKDKVELELKLEEMQAQLYRVIQKKENNDELESFQTQELAKVKHLLLRSQQELSEKEESIQKMKREAEATNRQLSSLEAETGRLRQASEAAKVVELQAEKKSLEEEIDRLKRDALRNSSILEVKDQTIEQLQERVTVLEKRLGDSSLSGDDMTMAILEERKVLEKKLEESHQQLSEIKTTWSEKIHSLEMQIFHLNKKMAEDNEESSRLEKESDDLRERFREEQEKLWAAEENFRLKEEEMQKLDKERRRLEESLQESELQAKSKVEFLHNQMAELVKEHQRHKQEDQDKISRLIAVQSEHVEKDIELERHITELEGENRRNKAELTKKGKECVALKEEILQLSSSVSGLKLQVTNLEGAQNQSESRLQNMQEELDQREKRIQSLTTECDGLMMRNAELSHSLELLRRETQEEGSNRDKEREDCENATYCLKQELDQAKRKIAEFDTVLASNTESSSKLTELKNALSEYESEIADKNKTIKLQQQRLADMKKALQKELRAQTDTLQMEMKPSQGSKDPSTQGRGPEDDINFKYLKHVIFKFMTCSEYEGQHLVKAICALLRFTQEEERLIKETLDWKSSWFGLKPHHPPSRTCPS